VEKPIAQLHVTTVTVKELNGVTLSPVQVTTYTYDVMGNKASETLPDGVVTAYTYDGQNNLISLITTNSTGTVLLSQVYTVNTDGMRVSLSENQIIIDNSVSPAVPLQVGSATAWTYDADNRLTNETVTFTYDDSNPNDDPVGNNYSTTYTYDLDGNRQSMAENQPGSYTTTTTTYDYNGDDELTSQAEMARSRK
jgi:YD repeat-containing protein